MSNVDIAKSSGASESAVNEALRKLRIERRPWLNTAKAVLEAAWPSTPEFKRSEVTHYGVAKELVAFMRWRLGDPGLSKTQLHLAKRFWAYSVTHNTVLTLVPGKKGNPWEWVPREGRDGQLVVRWPEGRERPKFAHMKAVTLPATPLPADALRYRW
ncbi:hypothetical protein GTY75_05040 [Streptomyces sp. SID8381]|uniref:hypothetical protein n=1 Tax=unclassified Streptomyces TaxID=2593676 RepID=UPI001319CA1C|nr:MULTISPECIES: hypothetical protein [unclassified Streptomyces]MYX26040.1 hypothetical protein [Streptomyces sp. SID8381]